MNLRDLKLGTLVHEVLAYLQMCRMLNIHFSLGERASDFTACPILRELLYTVDFPIWLPVCSIRISQSWSTRPWSLFNKSEQASKKQEKKNNKSERTLTL